MVTRVPVLDVQPCLEGGRYPAKGAVGEEFDVWARVFCEDRAELGVAVILTDPGGVEHRVAMTHVDNDYWSATFVPETAGRWTFCVESWRLPAVTWWRDARIKIEANVDREVMLADGALLLRESGSADLAAIAADDARSAEDRLADLAEHHARLAAVRDRVGRTDPLPLRIDAERALIGSWYELFPRSFGAHRRADGSVQHGTLRSAAARLDSVAELGFDVVYLPPIHPIGHVHRKGPNNTLVAGPDDPGSPWAIGSAAGGHDAVHPDLGTLADFDAFVERAGALGLDIALDLALQCAPDHPWVTEHPGWFLHRADGTIASAENPPKKYQDIYPLDFDADPEGLYVEILRVLRFWIARGVRIFRVDNPHTKPLGFWERLIDEVTSHDPEVVFLAEAFTVPAMLQALAKVGFHQSYTYFTWREEAGEMGAYLHELAHETGRFLRPNLWTNTPDILPRYLQGAPAAWFRMRAVLASTGSPSWGMYAGYEWLESTPAGPDTEEYLDSEKYQVVVRDDPARAPLAGFIARLNTLRRDHVALRRLRNLRVLNTGQAEVVGYLKESGDSRILVVADLQPSSAKTVSLEVDGSWFDALHDEAVDVAALELDPARPARVLIPASVRR